MAPQRGGPAGGDIATGSAGLLTPLESQPMFLAVLIARVCLPSADETVFEKGAKLEKLAGGGAGGEGPAWHPKLGVLMSSNSGDIRRYTLEGKSEVYRKKAGTNGLLFDARGRLIA